MDTPSRYVVKQISKIINTKDNGENTLVAIYHLEKNSFLIGNKAFKEFLGQQYVLLLNRGWDSWFTLIHLDEVASIKQKISNFCSLPLSVKQLDLKYHISNGFQKQLYIKHEILRYRLADNCLLINFIFDISAKEKIDNYFNVSRSNDNSQKSNGAPVSITCREKEVLKLIGEGYSSKQIADKLYISNHTAVSHRKNLIEKFKVKNTAHLVKRASELLEI